MLTCDVQVSACRLPIAQWASPCTAGLAALCCAAVQAVMFADDVKVSKGMVKYACGIPKESIVDVGGILTCPEAKIESATQKDVSWSLWNAGWGAGTAAAAMAACSHAQRHGEVSNSYA